MATLKVEAKVQYEVTIDEIDYEAYLDGDFDEDDLVDKYYDNLTAENEFDFEVTDAMVYDSI